MFIILYGYFKCVIVLFVYNMVLFKYRNDLNFFFVNDVFNLDI